ncbi:MAG: NERD domain-containing protein [Anaerolineae bacterium]
MAQIFPNKLNLEETPSRAERRLFDLFRNCLDDQYSVFHSRALQAKNPDIGIADREIDFIIAHPNRGLLVIEVKGGQITADERSGTWLQNGKPMKKTPVRQVRSAMYDLQKKLKEITATRNFDYSMSYVLALPDIHLAHDLTTDAPRAIVLDKADCTEKTIASAIENIHRYYNRRSFPGGAAIRALTSVLAPLHVLTSRLAQDFEEEEGTIKVLTEEQFDVLLDLQKSPRYLITGCAGSGKTMLAFEKARRLKEQGKRVLLVYYTSALARWMTENAPEGVEVMYFHELCRKLVKIFTPNPLPDFNAATQDAGDYYDGILPESVVSGC